MADRIQREIEEILAKLDEELPAERSGPVERKPISITSVREQRKASKPAKAARPSRSLSSRLEPSTLLFAGAGTMILGLVLANAVADPFIWLSFAGVVLFLAAFVWSFFRSPRPRQEMAPPGKVFWRDRFIEYEPTNSGFAGRLRRKIRRR